MIADVVNVGFLFHAVLPAGEDAADVRLADRARSKGSRIRQQRFQELDRNNLVALKLHRLGGEHTDVFETLHMSEIALTEGHEEADALHTGDILGEGLDLLVVQQIHVLLPDFLEVVLALDAHGGDLHPMAVLPIGAGSGHLTQVNLWVEVGGEGIAMIAAVAVENVDGVNLVEQVLLGVSAVRLRHAGIKARAQQSGETGLFKFLLVRPLVGIIEVGGEALLLAALLILRAPCGIGEILRLVVGGIQIIHAALQAGIHDRQILIRQSNVHHQIGLIIPNQRNHLINVVGVHLRGGDLRLGRSLQLLFESVAF